MLRLSSCDVESAGAEMAEKGELIGLGSKDRALDVAAKRYGRVRGGPSRRDHKSPCCSS